MLTKNKWGRKKDIQETVGLPTVTVDGKEDPTYRLGEFRVGEQIKTKVWGMMVRQILRTLIQDRDPEILKK